MLKTYRTIDDVLNAPWSNPKALLEVMQQGTTDHVLRSTKLEDSIYTDLRSGDGAMDYIEQTASKKLKTFSALSRDIYQSFYSLSPRKVAEDELSTIAKKFNVNILSYVTEQDDYPTMKNICEGRELLSYEATAEFVERIAGELDDLLSDMAGEKGNLRTLEKLENARSEAAAMLYEQLERYNKSANKDERLAQAVIETANAFDNKQRQVEAVSRMIDTSHVRQKAQVEMVVSSAMQAAKNKAEETQNIIGAWSDAPCNLSRTPLNMELLEKVRQNQVLLDISKYLGRFREIMANRKRNGFSYGRGETYSLELGNNLSRALTSELAMLATPETIPLFLRKYRNKQIKQYKRREPVFKGMGDIICCLDESGSTQGDKAAWGKAVALTMLEIAADSNRKFALVHFSGPGSVKTDVFLPGEYSIQDKLNAAEIFLGGGTNYETPMKEAMRLIEHDGFENADVLFITDGECEVSDEFLGRLQQKQTECRFALNGVLLDAGESAMDFSLRAFCQNIYRTSELTGDQILQTLVSDRM